MRYVLAFRLFVCLTCFNCCGQTKQNKYAPIDFNRHVQNIRGMAPGIIEFECNYEPEGAFKNNKVGRGRVTMIHKNGNHWWSLEAKKLFPKSSYPESRFGQLLERDTMQFKYYNKWAFFIDKKYLESKPTTGDDFSYTDAKGNVHFPSEMEIEQMENSLEYHIRKNSRIEVILYEQKAGSKKWIEIDRHSFKTDRYGDLIYEVDPHTGKQDN